MVGRNTRIQINDDFALLGGVVIDLLDLDFALVVAFHDALDKATRGGAVWYFTDDQCLLVLLTYSCTDAHLTTTQTVVVVGHVHPATCWEVRIECKRLVAQIGYGGVDKFVEVMRQKLGGQTHGDAFGTLCQQQWELHRQRDRLGITVIIGTGPVSGLMVEDDFFGELGETCLDVTRGSGIVASEDVTEVTLCVDKQVFLSKLHQSITNGCIAVRVVFHRVTHDVSHLVETTVVEFVHRMQDTTLHRLQAVLDGRHSTFEDDIRGVVEKPILEHAFQWYHMVFILLSLSVFNTFQSILCRHIVQRVIVFQICLIFFIHMCLSTACKSRKIFGFDEIKVLISFL